MAFTLTIRESLPNKDLKLKSKDANYKPLGMLETYGLDLSLDLAWRIACLPFVRYLAITSESSGAHPLPQLRRPFS